MLDLCNTKQKNGEPFMTFLQRWRSLFARYPCPVLDNEKMDIFIDNLNEEMGHALKMQCPPSFNKMFENEIKIKEALVKKGVLKI